jgi:GH35 family endo-1,4-beta-xylanase
MISRVFLRWVFLLACVLPGFGRAQTSYPAGPPLIATPQLNAWRLTGSNGLATQVDVAGPGFMRAWRIETRVDASPPWAIEFRAAVNRAVAKGDVGLVRFVARAVATSDESGAAYARLVVQKATADYAKSVEGTHTVLSGEWQEFFVPFTFGADYAANASEVVFGFGFKRQTVELGGFDCVYYGKSVALAALPRTRPSYLGREPGAAWRTAALARIEAIRKGDFAVAVVDAAGKPVPGATVRVEQRKAAFHFGSALQMTRIVNDTADNRIYRQKVLELFNAASTENDLKWPPWAGEWGAGFAQTQALAGLGWLRNHGLHVRGHVLVWPGWRNLPNAIQALRGTAREGEIPGRALAHIADVVGATRDLVEEWDVLNEPYANHDLMDLFGVSIQADWFRAARAAHGTAPLFLNDYSNHDAALDAAHVAHFETTARFLKAQGAPLGGLGLQAHISANPSPLTNVLAVLDRYAALGLPVRVTEFDINTDDEELQADYTRDFLIAMYSHASVVGVQHWGFWETAHWIPKAAMYRADWAEKPSARAYKALVLDQWRTRATGATDATGTWRGRGFQGDYRVTVEYGGKTYEQGFTLRAGAEAPTVRVPLASARLVNLSTRATAGLGDATLIPGFFIEGPAAKRVLVRGVGPGLAAFGVAGALARPELTLRRADGSAVATNRGWDTGSAAEAAGVAATAASVGAFALGARSGDCAVVATLEPGAYTAPVTSVDGGTGVALVEAYELEGVPGARLKNLSARARVSPGAGVVIPGLVVTGANGRTLLVRAVGPGLGAFGVSGTLARPALTVGAGGAPIAANTGWESSADPAALAAAAARAGAFALQTGRVDAALIVTLPAGAWTIQVSGADGGAGVVLVEIYDLGS